MKGQKQVLVALQQALHEELTAISQYFLHAEINEHRHYDNLARYVKKQSIDEMKHAELLIERILFLEDTPNLTEPLKLAIRSDVKAQIEDDLALEISAVSLYNRAIKTARDHGDNGSRQLFERLLTDEEQHVDWLEAQLHQIAEIGLDKYLSQQLPTG